MLFTTFAFLGLVCATLVIYYAPFLRRFQVPVLIVASIVFYAYGQAILLLLLLFSALLNAITSFAVFATPNIRAKRLYATLGVVINLAVLASFKYSPFFGEILAHYINLASVGAWLMAIPLPIGISFYTFQGISLVIDTYRGAMSADSATQHTKDFMETRSLSHARIAIQHAKHSVDSAHFTPSRFHNVAQLVAYPPPQS